MSFPGSGAPRSRTLSIPVNKNHDLINAFISNLNFTFSIIALSETWFNEDHSNPIDICNYNLISIPRQSRKSGGGGVPQGSVLGPLLFIIFLNDIAFSSDKFSFVTYADDTNVIVSHASLSDLITIVNHELNNLAVWFEAIKLTLNIDKTNYMIFKNRHSNNIYDDLNICIDGRKISRVSHTKFLSVLLDESLTWSNHTSNIVNILSTYCGILYRLREVLPSKALFSLYNTLVFPHLFYCNLI